MKPKSTLRNFLALAGSSILAISSASPLYAAAYYWDTNSTNAGFGTASGTWGTDAFWTTTNTGAFTVAGITSPLTTDTTNFGNTSNGLATGTITVNGTANTGSMTFASGSGNITLSGGIINLAAATTITANSTTATNTVGSDITGAGTSLTKAGAGILVLSGANTYTGKTIITAGTLSINSIQNAGSTTANALGTPAAGATSIIDIANGGRLRYTGTGHSSDRVINNTGTGNSTITLDASGASGTFALTGGVTTAGTSGTSTVALTGTGSGSQSGIISNGTGTNATAVTKTGIGTWVLGGINSYSGATTIQGGGSLVLDYGTNNTTKLSDTSALQFNTGGGNLILRGAASGGHVEAVGSFNLGAGGGHSTITREAGSTATISLGLITRNQSAGSTLSFAEGSIATTTSTVFRGMLGGGITVGSNWAKVDGSGNIIALASGDYTTLTAPVTADAVNYQLTGGLSIAGNVRVNSLRIEGTGATNQTLDLGAGTLAVSVVSGGANTHPFGNSGGILYAGGGTDNYTITSTGIIQGQNNNQELIINTYAGTLTLDMVVNTGSATAALTKTGEGTLILTKANTYSGGTFVNQGVLRLRNNAAAGTTGQITVGNGAALELANGVAIAAPLVANKVLTITGSGISSGGALRNVASNTSSYAGVINIGNGGARINSDADGTLTLTGGVVTTAFNNVTFGGAGKTTVETAAISGAGGLIKDGAGTTTLTATNTYTGTTSINQGTLAVNGTGSINSSAVTINGGTFRYNSSVAYSGALTFTSGTIGGTNLSGSLDNLTIGTNQSLSPGNSPGTATTNSQTWAGGGSYIWEINNATGTAGTDPGWDLLSGTGTLTITATSGSQFNLNLFSLLTTPVDTQGALTNFINSTSYNWLIADFANTIVGYDANAFNVIATNFANNNTLNGTFGVALGNTVGGDDTQLYLTYTAIPEPGTALLGSLGVLLLFRRRR